jgi:maleate isomerase
MTAPASVDVAERVEEGALSLEQSTGYVRARVSLMIPSGNRMIEPQFRHFAPDGMGFYVTRLRMTGKHEKPLPGLLADVAETASLLSDAKPDLIGFHCTATSMRFGAEGDAQIVETITKETGIPAISTGAAVTEALQAMGIRRLVLVTPYVQKTNDHEKHYLDGLGFEVVHDVALGMPNGTYSEVSPGRWIEIVRANRRDAADGYFMSCTSTTQIDTVELLERELGKPVVSSNQAMIWASRNRLAAKLGGKKPIAGLGRLLA